MEDSLHLRVEAFIPINNPQKNPEANGQIYFMSKNSPLYSLSIDFEDAYLEKTRNISCFYFTENQLKELYKKIEKPPNAEEPIDPPKLRKWCGLCSLDIGEKERNINNYFNDLRNENSVRGNICRFFQTVKQPLTTDPLSIFTKIKEYLSQKHHIEITDENPLERSHPKREFIILNGKRLYKMGSNDKGGSANVEKYGLVNDSAPRYILKKFDVLNKKEKENSIKQYLNEYSAFLSKLDHPNIIEYKELVNVKTGSTIHYVCILMKYCNRGDLQTFIENNHNFSENEAKDFLTQILKAFKYLKSLNPPIMHGDLKPENILIHEPDPKNNPRKYEVKLADFGCCQQIFKKDIHLFHPIRSLYTCSPQQIEVIRKKLDDTIMNMTQSSYSDSCDVWGLGIILYYMLYKNYPFWINREEEINERSLIKKLKQIFFDENGKAKNISINFPEYPPVSPELKSLICEMLVVDEQKRISFEELFIKFKIKEQIQKEPKKPNQKKSFNEDFNSRKSSMINSIHASVSKTYSAENYRNYYINQHFILGIPPEMPNNEESKENNLLKSSLSNFFSKNNIEEETTLSGLHNKEDNNGNLLENEDVEYSIEGNESAILFEMEYQEKINKCEKFIGILRNLINRMEKLPHNCGSEDLKVLCFLLNKWKYAIFFPVLKEFLSCRATQKKMRGIKLKIVKLLSVRKVKREILTKDFLDLLKDKKIFVELISDNIIDSNDFVQFFGDLLAEFMKKLTNEISEWIRIEQKADQIKEYLGIYQDLGIILNANQWFSQIDSPMNRENIEKKRNKMYYMDLIKDLKIKINMNSENDQTN